MPTNLNALIRYKQIDACLSNPFSNCTIEHLREVCTQSLGENRGVYKKVSERTIRDDIRVMKSDMLGFNAPIAFKDGCYVYTDPDFSIFSTPLTEKKLLKDILTMLLAERENFKDEEIDHLLRRIANVVGEHIPEVNKVEKSKLLEDEKVEKLDKLAQVDEDILCYYDLSSKQNFATIKPDNKEAEEVSFQKSYKKKEELLLWKDIFELF